MTKRTMISFYSKVSTVDELKAANERIGKDGVFPKWWWTAIVVSGIAFEVAQRVIAHRKENQK